MPLEHKDHSWPWTTVDRFKHREWVHIEPPRYYLHQSKDDKLWRVVFRDWDASVGQGYKRKSDAIRAFVKQQRESLNLPPASHIQLSQ